MTRCLLFLALTLIDLTGQTAEKPNIVYILCDDLGYGDLKCLNREGKIATPNFDSIAAAGMAFTDAHSGSAVCTPTRYGILTGRYAWRTRLQRRSRWIEPAADRAESTDRCFAAQTERLSHRGNR